MKIRNFLDYYFFFVNIFLRLLWRFFFLLFTYKNLYFLFPGKGRGKNRKESIQEIGSPDGSQTLASLAKSLAAVKEDPSLLIGLEGGPTLKKVRGRPKKNDDNKKSPKSPKVKKVKKAKKVKKTKVENSDDEW